MAIHESDLRKLQWRVYKETKEECRELLGKMVRWGLARAGRRRSSSGWARASGRGRWSGREEREARRKVRVYVSTGAGADFGEQAMEESERQRKEQNARSAGGTREPSAARRREAFHKIERRWVYHDDDEMDADSDCECELDWEQDVEDREEEVPPLPTLSAFVDNAKPAKAKGTAREFEIVESLPRVIALYEEDDDGIDDWEEV